jgi:hypothetical protein
MHDDRDAVNIRDAKNYKDAGNRGLRNRNTRVSNSKDSASKMP